MPDVPTVDESGIKGYEVKAWSALYVGADTPKDVVDTLANNVRAVLAMPDVQKRLLDVGIVADPLTAEAQTKRMTTEIEKWRVVIQQGENPAAMIANLSRRAGGHPTRGHGSAVSRLLRCRCPAVAAANEAGGNAIPQQ